MNTADPNRSSYRNEAITLRALLKVACATLRCNRIDMPKVLEQWYLAQRNLAKLRQPKLKDKPVAKDITVDSVHQAIMRGDIDIS